MRRRLPWLLALTLLVASGCEGGDPGLVVLTASSLVDVTEALVAAADVEAAVSEAGSQVLAAQIRSGAPADVAILADPGIAAALAEEGRAGPPVPVASNGLAIVVSHRAPTPVRGPRDLATPGLRLVLADRGVPLGDYTRDALTAIDPALAEQVVANADSFEDAARVVLAKVVAGEADAAIVYATDAATATGDRVEVLTWPEESDVRAVYTVQLVEGADPAAEDLARFVTSTGARQVWREYGFGPP